MAPSMKNSNSSSNCGGEVVGNQANVLASCYIVDSSARLSGFHYSTTGAGGGIPEVRSGSISPPSSPPLAALTSANEFASIHNSSKKRDSRGRTTSRKEGAAYAIREECERLFCENMKTIFLGEEGSASNDSSVMGANTYSSLDDVDTHDDYFGDIKSGHAIDAWVEIWDYTGGCSFRGFVGGIGDEKTLFAFFDSSVIGRDLKQGLIALIELAEEVFAVSQVVIFVDRSIPEGDRSTFLKSLRWVGFELTTLDMWSHQLDTTSNKWLLMGLEV
ncbi:ornithine decarboxylase antizyme [Sclerotinia borealis F-4128]|uniref:Ornithine decarboxylase antizyme n=1 Tax=Sclerotinia borealis (strain F-4128) TaxID=1432307 RepID=W9C6N7_SCLBF|nr:ornithine decarboxylase antizyme [Sclerotinia borealis F-4128]